MTKPDDKRVPLYKWPAEEMKHTFSEGTLHMQAVRKMQRAVEVLAEIRAIEKHVSGYMGFPHELRERIQELRAESDRLLTELEVEVKRG